MPDHFDVIVVGIGAMGAAVCHQLAARGQRVLGLEQYTIPHALGSSHGQSRMIRLAYYEHPDYVPLLLRAYDLWNEIESQAATRILHTTGGLYAGPQGCELVTQSIAAAKLHGLAHAELNAKQIAGRFPQFQVPANFTGMFEPRAGFVIPETAIKAFVAIAKSNGAKIRKREEVLEWSADASGVRVRTSQQEYRAERIIFTAGPWTSRLLKDLNVPLRVTRQPMFWFSPWDASQLGLGKLPVFAIDRPAGGIYYGFPVWDGDQGLKVACHCPGDATEPDQVSREVRDEDVAEVRDAIRKFLPAGDGPVLSHRVCLYTNSPDSHFIIDRHPTNERITFACGFSGHGFKFSSVVGEILADLSMRGKTTLPAQFLEIGRFSPPGPRPN